jgi:GrpB-like predicted nucleotidyltransferase (UPF0157 family)
MSRSDSLGLRKGTVAIVPYHAAWHDAFVGERDVLRHHIGHLVRDIQHVGSTSIPGLDAKPILDIAVAVDTRDAIASCRAPLLALGYIDRGDGGQDGGYLFVREAAPLVRTHHLHIVTRDDPQWANYLRFREVMRADATLRARYAALKHTLRRLHPDGRAAYLRGKDAFIRDVLSRSDPER